ncbi:MAG: hypothetical protein WBB29_11050 [Geitlerinemataceae cyanobacterium]
MFQENSQDAQTADVVETRSTPNPSEREAVKIMSPWRRCSGGVLVRGVQLTIE